MSKYESVYSVLQKPVAEHSRNVFPLENAHSYSMKAGQITPIKAFHYKPKDFLKMKVSDFSITFPMNTAPFLRGRKEFAFYNVYYNSIWSLFNQFQSTRNDNKTSAFGQSPDLAHEPSIPLLQLYSAVLNQWLGYMDYTHFISLDNTTRDEDSLAALRGGWLLQTYNGPFAVGDGGTGQSIYAVLTDITKFSHDFWVDLSHDFTGNVNGVEDRRSVYLDIVGQWRWSSYCRKLDMFGYGNIYPLLRAAENYIIDLIADCDFTNTSDVQLCQDNITDRVMALIKTIVESCIRYTGTIVNPVYGSPRHVNLYPICAYNSIFYHFFRNSFYDLNYWVRDYSLDFVQNLMVANELKLEYFSRRFLDIEYHQWKKDRFTGVLPDQQFGAVSSMSLNVVGNLNDYNVYVNGLQTGNVDGSSISPTYKLQMIQGQSYGSVTVKSGVTSSTNFDVIALKRAEMLQNYRQTLMRAGNKTTDVFRALYGQSPSSEHVEDIIPQFLETFGEDIFIDPVTSTADTGQGSQGNLGDLSARGKFSGQSGNIQFNAGGNFGCLICLAYVVPTAEYNSYMLDPHLSELTPEQHFIPQFENLGLEDIYSDELNCLRSLNNLASRGKAPRYHHKKSEVDQVHGAFCSLQLYDNWGLKNYFQKFYGDFNHWVSPRTDMQQQTNLRLRDFYINPNVLDNVFVQKAGADFSSDQFICRTYFDLTSTKEMSKVGLVNFV